MPRYNPVLDRVFRDPRAWELYASQEAAMGVLEQHAWDCGRVLVRGRAVTGRASAGRASTDGTVIE